MSRFSLLTAALLLTPTAALAGDYSTTANERPLVLPAEMTQLSAAFGYVEPPSFAVGGISDSLAVGAQYGISDGMDIAVALPPYALGDGGGLFKVMGVGVGYSIMDEDDLDVAAGLNVPLAFEDGMDTIPAIGIDADTRYALMDGALAIRTGHGLINYLLGDGGGLMLGLNLGVTYQITDAINVDIDTPLYRSFDGGSTSIADAVILDAGVAYNMDDIDVGVRLSDVTEEMGDRGVTLFAAYRL